MVTKMQIAKKVGVSHTAVCQILNQNPNARISDKIRQRILDTAKEMGYYDLAQKIKTKKTPILLYILSGVERPNVSYMYLYNVLQYLALKQHRAVAFINIGINGDTIDDVLALIDSISPLGVIIDGSPSEFLVDELIKRKLILVNIGTNWLSIDQSDRYHVPFVTYDIEKTLFSLMGWFVKRGAKKIAMNLGLQSLPINRELIIGYKKAISSLGLVYDPALIQSAEDHNSLETFNRLEILDIEYDAIILGSLGRAIHIVPHLEASNNKNLTRKIGVITPFEMGRDYLRDLVFCGPSVEETAENIYKTMSSEINYQKKKIKPVIVPSKLYIPPEH